MASRTAHRQITLRDFSGGEYGLLGPMQAKANQFTASNLLRDRTGRLYPRPGLEDYPLSGLPTGVLHGIGWNGTPGADLWVMVGTAFFVRDSGDFSAAWTAASGDEPVSEPNEALIAIEADGGITYVLVPGQGLFKLTHAAGPTLGVAQIADVDSNMAGRAMSVYRERLFVGGMTPGNRIYYSDVDNFDSFPAESFFDAPGKPQVRAMFHQRDHLALARQDGSWWIMSGRPVNGTFRKQFTGQHPWHFFQPASAMLANDAIWYVPVQGTWPSMFDGTNVEELRYLEYAGRQGLLSGGENVGRLGKRDEVMFVSGDEGFRGDGLAFLEGVWVRLDIDPETTQIAGGLAVDQQGMVFLTDAGGVGVTPRVWRLDMSNPGIPNYRSRGDDGPGPINAWVEFPYLAPEDGREVRVRQVVIDYEKYDTGSSAVHNHFEVKVQTLSHGDGEGIVASSSAIFDESPDEASTVGTRQRFVANVGDQGYGGRIRVRIEDIVGVAIEQVILDVEPATEVPRR